MEIARYWRMNNQRYNLTGSVCGNCGKRHISPRPVCDTCYGDNGLSGKDVATLRASTYVSEPAHK